MSLPLVLHKSRQLSVSNYVAVISHFVHDLNQLCTVNLGSFMKRMYIYLSINVHIHDVVMSTLLCGHLRNKLFGDCSVLHFISSQTEVAVEHKLVNSNCVYVCVCVC